MAVYKRNGKKFNKAIKLAVTIATLGMFIACGDDSSSSAPEQTSESIESADTDLVVKTFDDLPVCSNKREGSTAYVKDEKVAYVCEDGDWTPDSDENVNKKSSSSGKASSSSSKKTQSSSSNDKAKSSSSGKASSSSSVSKTSSSSSDKETSSSSFKYEQDSSAYVQPKVVAVKNKSISGLSQKGPFVTGSTVKLYELDGKTFAQTGKSFSGKISSDDGKFSVSSVSLASQYALLEATGYFRNEVTGGKSNGTITLNAITDLSDRKNVNVNLLTHLEYERVMHLIESGINFTAAKKQTKAEILNAFGIKGEFANSEDLDIFGKGDGNAALLAFSVLMLGGTVDEYGDYKELSEAELTERLTKFATDIAKDGSWDDEKTKVAIADRAARYSQYEAYESDYNGFGGIRQSIEKWNLGAVPDFEKYVRNFWTDVYGLGKCDSKNEGTVVATKNERSNTYGSNVRFICKEGTWKHASDLEKDTYQWAAGKDGEIKAGDITKRNYDYDGKLKKWRYAIGAEVVLGGCTETREKDFSQNTGRVDQGLYSSYYRWYICKNREWKETDSMTVDTQAWDKGDDGELRKGDSTVAIYKYDEALKKWISPTRNDTTLKLNGCTVNRKNEISKSSVDDSYYACMYDDDNCRYDWFNATEAQINTSGEKCTTNELGKIINGSVTATNKYYCTGTYWVNMTLGWSWEVPKELRFNPEITYGTMTDPRDKKIYKIVKIVDQVWMAENLNYADSIKTPSLKGRSKCFHDSVKYCDVGGRFYTLAAAIDSVASYDGVSAKNCNYECRHTIKVQGICPSGWHLPNISEWETLQDRIGAKVLRSQTGWDESCNGLDAYGFSALPVAGNSAVFWSSTLFSNDPDDIIQGAAVFRIIGDDHYASIDYNGDRSNFRSVRCLQD